MVQTSCVLEQRQVIEAAAHAMREMFEADESEGLLLVDAANAFNALNRPAALWNCRLLWPRCSLFLFNYYCGYDVILLKGLYSRKLLILLSQEGTTQGCPWLCCHPPQGSLLQEVARTTESGGNHPRLPIRDVNICNWSLPPYLSPERSKAV